MAPRAGLEPATSALTVPRNYQLCYRGIKLYYTAIVTETALLVNLILLKLAGPERLELPTSSFEDWHSIH